MQIIEKDWEFENLVKILSTRITEEIFIALGGKRFGLANRIFGPLFGLPTRRFARIAANFENDVVNKGPQTAAANALPGFAMQVMAHGIENIPTKGPVLIVSNHPGGLDSLALVSSIPRQDIKALVSDIPFLNTMTGIRKHVIFVDFKTIGGMNALRQAIQHLKDGGALLLFAHGDVEPDPGIMEGAQETIAEWSPSIEIMLRKVPETRLVIATVKNALLSRFIFSPLTRLRKEPTKRQKLGEFIQVIQQMLSPQNLDVHPQIRFSSAINTSSLGEGKWMPLIISLAQRQMDSTIKRR